MLLPFMEEQTLINLYDFKQEWTKQNWQVASTVIPAYVCPSNSSENPITDKLFDFFGGVGCYKPGVGLGITTYSFCKGVSDQWCVYPAKNPPTQRGMFDVAWGVPLRKILDGTSNTIAAGEAAGGPNWPLADANYDKGKTSVTMHMTPAQRDSQGQTRYAMQAWIASQPGDRGLTAVFGLIVASTMACTLEPINKSPVTNAQSDPAYFDQCSDLSLPPAKGTTGYYMGDVRGTHFTPNFRSDHPGGANFLFADGSVHFLNGQIDMLTYQRLSTIAGNEVVVVPE